MPDSRPSAPQWRRLITKELHFDIDNYLNPFLPTNQVRRLPRPIARFLGHRDASPGDIGNILVSLWALVGAFLGLLVVATTYKFSHHLASYHPPVLFASLGATAILDYNTIQSPLAQPRAAILGHTLSAVIGVGIGKLFMLSPDYESLRWIAGPTACAAASWAMAMTNSVHPPGGATAVLAAVDPTTVAMGWMFVPFILLGSGLMLGVALLVNNIQRQFPVFWWTPREVGGWWEREASSHDIESARHESKAKGDGGSGRLQRPRVLDTPGYEGMIVLTPDCVLLPKGFQMEAESVDMLEVLRNELREWREDEHYMEERELRVQPVNSETSMSSEKTRC